MSASTLLQNDAIPRNRNSWRAIGASVAGISHHRTGQPCQDAFAHRILDSGIAIAVVADGAGSATMGGAGAEISCRTSVLSVAATLDSSHPQTYIEWQALFRSALAEAQTAIQERADAEKRLMRDYASTLLIVVAGAEWVACGAIGDCAAVFQDRCGNLESLCPPQRGEYANATHFVTGADAQERLTVRLRSFPFANSATAGNAISNLALLTDGLLELALNVAHNRPFAPFFQPLFAFAADVDTAGDAAGAREAEATAAADLATFLSSERINSRTHDDKTLLLLSNYG